MRLNRLDLIKYGAFADRSMTLREGAKLHVVLGANEAGKSSTLAAVGDLLFGFPMRTPYDFRFKKNELRLAGEVTSRGGERLDFERRKGTKKTLLDPSGAELGEGALGPWLGQMTREIFTGAFGLNADTLRKGAEEMLQARGEVGSSLMAAASGVRGLTRIRKEIETKAESIFTPTFSKYRSFYQARERYDAAKKAVSNLELGKGALKKLNESIAQGEAQQKDFAEAATRRRTTRARIERLSRLAPLLRKIEAQEQALAALVDLPATPPGLPQRLGQALMGVERAQEALSKAERERAEAQLQLASVSVETSLVERAVEIEALVVRIGEAVKGMRDLPGLEREQAVAKANLDGKARALGLADGEAVVMMQPTDGLLARLSALADEGRELVRRRADLEETLRNERDDLAEIDALNQPHAYLVDPAPLREQWQALGIGTALAEHNQKATILRREEESLHRDALRLHPPVMDLAHLAVAPLPPSQTIISLGERFDKVEVARRDLDRAISDVEGRIASLRSSLAELAAGVDVPTPELIASTRATRTAEWALLRATLFAEAGALTGAALAGGVARFERASAQADDLADAAASDAERVASFAAQTKTLANEEVALAGLRSERAAQIAAGDAWALDWAALWSPLGVSPLGHREMATWRSALDGLLDRHARQADLRDAVRAARDDLASLSSPLAALTQACGLVGAEGLDIARQALRVEARLQELDKLWGDARDQARKREDILRRIDKLERDCVVHDDRAAAWSSDWRDVLPKAKLAPDATVIEVHAAIEIWKSIPADVKELDRLTSRVVGIRRDLSSFEHDARLLLETLTPDLLSLPSASGVNQLNQRLAAARTASARREVLSTRLEACEAALRKAQGIMGEALGARDEIAAALPPCDDLGALQVRLSDRDAIAGELAGLRAQFAEQADGLPEAQARDDLGDFDPDLAKAELAALAQEDERADQEAKEAYSQLKEAERQMEEWTQGLGSEAASQQRVNAEAEMQEAARAWLVLRLAGAMLDDALERHRATRQDPLMLRASALFAALTGGAFSGIGQSFGEDDAQVLAGIRANGEEVAIEGLSEGTRDQLYLALRLAYVEDYAARAEPAPFIADDLFTNFDDARTAHGLRVLADVGAQAQCVLFTHHRHVADLARAALGEGLDFIEL